MRTSQLRKIGIRGITKYGHGNPHLETQSAQVGFCCLWSILRSWIIGCFIDYMRLQRGNTAPQRSIGERWRIKLSERDEQENVLSVTTPSDELPITTTTPRSRTSGQDQSSLDISPSYWERVRERARELGSDGCSKVPDINLDCCYEHDIHWRTGMTLDGEPISVQDANNRFWRCNTERSVFGKGSPLAAWRWLGVSLRGLLK